MLKQDEEFASSQLIGVLPLFRLFLAVLDYERLQLFHRADLQQLQAETHLFSLEKFLSLLLLCLTQGYITPLQEFLHHLDILLTQGYDCLVGLLLLIVLGRTEVVHRGVFVQSIYWTKDGSGSKGC